MSEPIQIGDHVIAYAEGWNGTIGKVESIRGGDHVDNDYIILNIVIVYSPLSNWNVGDTAPVHTKLWSRYMP